MSLRPEAIREQDWEHLYKFLNAYNFAKRLKTLHGLTPYEQIIKCWQNEPARFRINPHHHKVGLNIYHLESTTNLNGGIWEPVSGSEVYANGSFMLLYDFNSPAADQRFYRSVSP